MSIFDKYTANIDTNEIENSRQEINKNAGGSGNREVPVGTYEVKVEKMEAKISSKNNPMVVIWFRILEGEYKNSVIFMNSAIHEDWMRHKVVDMLASLMDDDTHVGEINLILKSKNIRDVNDFVMDVQESIDGKFEYLLEYGQKKGFNTYTIKSIFDC